MRQKIFYEAGSPPGPVPVSEIEEEAKAHGVSVTGALKRARVKLEVKCRKEPGKLDGKWFLELPKNSRHPDEHEGEQPGR
jgi:hypothetical protein